MGKSKQTSVLKQTKSVKKGPKIDFEPILENYRMIAENASDGIFVFADMMIKYANPAFARMGGYKVNELINNSFKRFLPAEEIPKIEGLIGKLTDINNAETPYETKILCKDGSLIDAEIHISSISYLGKDGVLGIIRDITERKKAQKAIYDSEDRFRRVFFTSPDSININRLEDGVYVDINEGFMNLTGYSREEVIGKSSYEIKIWKDTKDRDVIVKAITENGIIKNHEAKFVMKNGAILDGLMSASLINIDKVPHIISITRDISELKNTEIALHSSEARHYDLFNKSLDGVYKSTHEGKFIEVNQAMVTMLGYESKEELLAVDIRSQLYFQSSDRESAELEEKYQEMAVFRMRKKDGSEVWVEDHGRIEVDGKGNVLFHEGIMRDVTDRVRADSQLQKYSEELKISNATKDKFFSIISHDLRVPFNTFLNLSELMVSEFETLSKEDLRDFAFELNKSAKTQYMLLENLLSWSSMQINRMEFHASIINLSELVEKVIDVVSDNAAKKGIILINSSVKNTLVSSDNNMLFSILQNLISNAIKFTFQYGKVEIRDEDSGDFVKVSVIDNGRGIPQDILDKIFRIDTKVSYSGTSGEKGTGLGLVLCREMIEKHGGKIWVESEEGKGSIFSFTLKKA